MKEKGLGRPQVELTRHPDAGCSAASRVTPLAIGRTLRRFVGRMRRRAAASPVSRCSPRSCLHPFNRAGPHAVLAVDEHLDIVRRAETRRDRRIARARAAGRRSWRPAPRRAASAAWSRSVSDDAERLDHADVRFEEKQVRKNQDVALGEDLRDAGLRP